MFTFPLRFPSRIGPVFVIFIIGPPLSPGHIDWFVFGVKFRMGEFEFNAECIVEFDFRLIAPRSAN